MSRADKTQVIVAGEASESDEDDNERSRSAGGSKNKQAVPQQQRHQSGSSAGVVVSGEASESDEEVDQVVSSTVPPLKVDESGQGDTILETSTHDSTTETPSKPMTRVQWQPKYDTVLHHKLREKNCLLSDHLHEFAASLYTKSAKEIRAMAQHTSKSQALVQDISHCMSLLTNDLFHLEDKIDIVATCNILPDINIDIPAAPPPPAPAPAGSGGDSNSSSAKSSPSR